MTGLSFRPLLLFWAATLVALAAGAATLQVLGPPVLPGKPVAVTSRQLPQPVPLRPPPPKPPARPARLPASNAHPVPDLPMTAASIPDPDPALLEPSEDSPDRMLPRAAGGRLPAQLYAAAFDPAERHPRVALVLDGAGLDWALTMQAISVLPSTVDLAFSAYAPEDTSADLARVMRRQGRECLVSVPMEPSGYPSSEEGNRALLTGGDAAQNHRNLQWALSNVAGCIGATGGSDGLNGERFAESSQAFGDVLSEVDQRGLIYLDARPGADVIADAGAAHRAPPRVADVIVDRIAGVDEPADAEAIDRNLAQLEAAAAHHGSAIGLAGPPRPVLLDRIAVWAHGLAARGIVLAPLTAIPVRRPDDPSPPERGTAP